MKPENIKRLIKTWKDAVKYLDKESKSYSRNNAHFSAAASYYEARNTAKCISELEHAIKPKQKD